MQNPWLSIPLSDYEGHMSLPEVAQAGMLSREFEVLLRQYVPESVAILGCSGGSGFDRISPNVTSRVVGVDKLSRPRIRWNDGSKWKKP